MDIGKVAHGAIIAQTENILQVVVEFKCSHKRALVFGRGFNAADTYAKGLCSECFNREVINARK